MTESTEGRVAVYIDFDNIVISRYNQLYGKSQFQQDRVRDFHAGDAEPDAIARVTRATVDLGAVLDYASSFGTIVLSRAYADWSAPINAGYRKQLIGRAVDLTQLFPTTTRMKNGADIRLAVDVVEDLFRLPDLTHVVIVAGDSDYIALAQRSKRLGRFVVGIGVAGATSKSLAAACDEFADYDALPGTGGVGEAGGAGGDGGTDAAGGAGTEDERREDTTAEHPASTSRSQRAQSAASTPVRVPGSEPSASAGEGADADDAELDADTENPQDVATGLLVRALRLGHAKEDADWLHSSAVKTQIKRMDPSFNEKALGFRSFSDFVTSRSDVAEMTEDGQARLLRLRGEAGEE